MNLNIFNTRNLTILTIILFGALMRFVPHWPNFTPIAAIALFGGAYFSRRWMTFLIPLTALLLSDLVIGFHNSMWAVYSGFIITVMIGWYIGQRKSMHSIILGSLASSVIFFLITNFAAWLVYPMYTKDFQGLITSYIAGLAFFNNGSLGISFFLNDVIGTLLYSGIFFSIFSLAEKRFPALAK